MWVTVRDAAALLVVSEDTVRRRLKAGTLPARHEPTRSGFRWLVEVPDPAPEDAPAAPPHAPSPDSDGAPANGHATEVAALRELVDVLQRERATLVEELDARRREVSELHILLGRAQGRGLPPQAVTAAPARGSAAPPQMPPRRRLPWWERLLRTLLPESPPRA